MSNITLINLQKISKNIYSGFLCKKAKELQNIPKFFNMWEYIEKFCDKELINDERFLGQIEKLIKDNLKFDNSCYTITSSEYLQFEATKVAADFLDAKYNEVLCIMSEAAKIYHEHHEEFLDDKTINIINSCASRCNTDSIHYETFNLLFTLLDAFHYRAGQNYEAEVLKVLNYIYVICDRDMMRIFENNDLKYKDFCSIFIYNNKKLSEIDHVRKFEMAVGNIGFENLFEIYKGVRVYD